MPSSVRSELLRLGAHPRSFADASLRSPLDLPDFVLDHAITIVWGGESYAVHWGTFASPSAETAPFFARHRVWGIARSDELAVWAVAATPAQDDPLVCVRFWDEDDDDFEAIEREGRAFVPLSSLLAGAWRV